MTPPRQQDYEFPQCALPSQSVTSDEAGPTLGNSPSNIEGRVHLPPLELTLTKEEWQLADEELATSVVPAVLLCESVEEKNTKLRDGVYQFFAQRFGVKQLRRKKPTQGSGQMRNLKKLTQQKNEARKRLRSVKKNGSDEATIRRAAQEFHHFLRLHSRECRLSSKSRAKLEAFKARNLCAKSFWHFAAQLLDGNKLNVSPAFNVKEAESFFRQSYRSTSREFVRPSWLSIPPSPATEFNDNPILHKEVQQAIVNSRSNSTPSPRDQISYAILKHCPSLTAVLLDLYNACWSSGSVPAAWKVGVIRLIPKASAEEQPGNQSNFRPIALTPCIGKIFTTILKNRWLSYMVQNNYMDTNIQKAFVNGIPGCAEHQIKLATAINDARKRHHSFTICWLDLANAYGSVHHKLIHFSLQHYHAPDKLINTITSIYNDLSAEITAANWATSEIPLQVGVYQGDPLSTVIFNTVPSSRPSIPTTIWDTNS